MLALAQDYGDVVVAVVVAVLMSSGFWTYLMSRRKNDDSTTKLLMGLAHDTILTRGDMYLRRGYITNEEYNDLVQYLVGPYMALGGNGMAERLIGEIKKLPIQEPEAHFKAAKEAHGQLHIPRSR
jgi:hypothetical protein